MHTAQCEVCPILLFLLSSFLLLFSSHYDYWQNIRSEIERIASRNSKVHVVRCALLLADNVKPIKYILIH